MTTQQLKEWFATTKLVRGDENMITRKLEDVVTSNMSARPIIKKKIPAINFVSNSLNEDL